LAIGEYLGEAIIYKQWGKLKRVRRKLAMDPYAGWVNKLNVLRIFLVPTVVRQSRASQCYRGRGKVAVAQSDPAPSRVLSKLLPKGQLYAAITVIARVLRYNPFLFWTPIPHVV
jgi:hypothetical protein